MTDLELINLTLDDYILGGTMGDRARVARAFHPSAYMKFIKEGQLIDVPIREYFERYIQEGMVQSRTGSVERVDVSGCAGSAKVILDYPLHQFVDYFNLLKVGEQWLIVSKIFQRIEKPL